jgi:hypothetical protein
LLLCCVASHNDAVSFSLEAFFVFIISAEKPQRRAWQLPEKKSQASERTQRSFSPTTKRDLGPEPSNHPDKRRAEALLEMPNGLALLSEGVNKINFRLIFPAKAAAVKAYATSLWYLVSKRSAAPKT